MKARFLLPRFTPSAAAALRLLPAAVLTLIVASQPAALHAQPFVATIAQRAEAPTSIIDLLRSSLEWSSANDSTRERMPKWYMRWEAFAEQRLGPDGSRADARAHLEAVAEIAVAKRSGRARLSGSGWYPVGPHGPVHETFSQIPPGIGRINCVTFHPSDSNVMWAGVAQGGVWRTDNGGESWRPLTDDLPILRISDIAVDPTDTDVLYISVGDYGYIGVDLVHADRKRHTHYGLGVYKSTDGGATWSPTGLSLALDEGDASLIRRVFIDPRNSARLLAAGAGGTWQSTDAGATWRRGRTDLIWDIERDPVDPDLLHASTGYLGLWRIGAAGLIRSSDFGETWQEVAPEIPEREIQRIEIAIAPSDPSTVYAVASNLEQGFHSLWRSTDAGSSWSRVMQQSNESNILSYALDTRGGQGAYDLAIIVDEDDPEKLYVGGILLWGSNDGGVTWTRVISEPEVHPDMHYFARNPLTGRVFLCNDGGIISTDRLAVGIDSQPYMVRWRSHERGMAITSFYRVGISWNAPGYVVAGAQDNASFYFDRAKWVQIFTGDGMDCFIDPDAPEQIYGSYQYGNLRMSRNGGESSRTVRRAAASEVGEWTTPYAPHPTETRVHYAAYGNLWRGPAGDTLGERLSSFDRRPIPDDPNNNRTPYPTPITAMALSPADAGRYYLAMKIWHPFRLPSEVWTTSDGGDTWRDITAGLPDSLYPTSIVTHPRDPLTAWVTYSGFVAGSKVFVTTDGGSTWSNMSRNLPNIPVNVVVHDRRSDDNTLYIGTDIGVFATSDRLDRWEPFADNLPNVIVSDLELHPASGTLYAATFGRGVWAVDLGSSGVRAQGGNDADNAFRVTEGAERGTLVIESTMSEIDLRDATVEVIDVLGRRLHASALTMSGNGRHVLPVRLASGLYFVRVVSGKGSWVVRSVVDG